LGLLHKPSGSIPYTENLKNPELILRKLHVFESLKLFIKQASYFIGEL
jgi:hypothetical protein